MTACFWTRAMSIPYCILLARFERHIAFLLAFSIGQHHLQLLKWNLKKKIRKSSLESTPPCLSRSRIQAVAYSSFPKWQTGSADLVLAQSQPEFEFLTSLWSKPPHFVWAPLSLVTAREYERFEAWLQKLEQLKLSKYMQLITGNAVNRTFDREATRGKFLNLM